MMITQKLSLPEQLDRYLRTSSENETTSIPDFLEKGGALVTNEAIVALRDILPALKEKNRGVRESQRLQRRLDILIRYFEETLGDVTASLPARRDVTFALFYFLKGYDRIPDSLPEIGLLDDAIVVNEALQRHLATLREHWLKRGRNWPDNP